MAYNWDKMVTVDIPDGVMGWHNTGFVVVNGKRHDFVVGRETEVPEPVAENIYKIAHDWSLRTAAAVPGNDCACGCATAPWKEASGTSARTTGAKEGYATSVVTTIAPSLNGVGMAKLGLGGKSILDGYEMAKGIAKYIGDPNSLNEKTKTITYRAGAISAFRHSLRFAKENTSYTVILHADHSNTSKTANMVVRYDDDKAISTGEGGASFYLVPGAPTSKKSDASKTLGYMFGSNSGGTTTLRYDLCAVVEGDVGANGFTPCDTQHFNAYLPRSVYGGSIDWTKGEVTVTHDCIQSYNGETVPTGWISSTGALDTGAQVVYPLDTPITYKIAKHAVWLRPGQNVLHSDAGGTVVKYAVDTKEYIDEKFAAVSAAVIGG